MKTNINKHHLCFERKAWEREQFSRKIRQHPGMIIPLYIPTHNALHREIGPIQPPYRTLGLVALAHLYSLDSTDPYYVIPTQADYLWSLTEKENGQLGDEAYKYAIHLEDQIQFLGLRQEAA